jgi:hypothetical protein
MGWRLQRTAAVYPDLSLAFLLSYVGSVDKAVITAEGAELSYPTLCCPHGTDCSLRNRGRSPVMLRTAISEILRPQPLLFR